MHRNLLDVCGLVQDVNHEVGDGLVNVVGGDPRSSRALVGEQFVRRRWLVVGDRSRVKVAKGCSRWALEVRQMSDVLLAG